MSRVAWSGPARVRRLSASAIALLDALDAPNTRIAWSGARGQHYFSNGDRTPQQLVLGRTIDLLLSARLITRDRSADVPTYRLSDFGKSWLAANVDIH